MCTDSACIGRNKGNITWALMTSVRPKWTTVYRGTYTQSRFSRLRFSIGINEYFLNPFPGLCLEFPNTSSVFIYIFLVTQYFCKSCPLPMWHRQLWHAVCWLYVLYVKAKMFSPRKTSLEIDMLVFCWCRSTISQTSNTALLL